MSKEKENVQATSDAEYLAKINELLKNAQNYANTEPDDDKIGGDINTELKEINTQFSKDKLTLTETKALHDQITTDPSDKEFPRLLNDANKVFQKPPSPEAAATPAPAAEKLSAAPITPESYVYAVEKLNIKDSVTQEQIDSLTAINKQYKGLKKNSETKSLYNNVEGLIVLGAKEDVVLSETEEKTELKAGVFTFARKTVQNDRNNAQESQLIKFQKSLKKTTEALASKAKSRDGVTETSGANLETSSTTPSASLSRSNSASSFDSTNQHENLIIYPEHIQLDDLRAHSTHSDNGSSRSLSRGDSVSSLGSTYSNTLNPDHIDLDGLRGSSTSSVDSDNELSHSHPRSNSSSSIVSGSTDYNTPEVNSDTASTTSTKSPSFFIRMLDRFKNLFKKKDSENVNITDNERISSGLSSTSEASLENSFGNTNKKKAKITELFNAETTPNEFSGAPKKPSTPPPPKVETPSSAAEEDRPAKRSYAPEGEEDENKKPKTMWQSLKSGIATGLKGAGIVLGALFAIALVASTGGMGLIILGAIGGGVAMFNKNNNQDPDNYNNIALNQQLQAQNKTLMAKHETLIAKSETLIAQNETLMAKMRNNAPVSPSGVTKPSTPTNHTTNKGKEFP
jgi:hypothetical protein